MRILLKNKASQGKSLSSAAQVIKAKQVLGTNVTSANAYANELLTTHEIEFRPVSCTEEKVFLPKSPAPMQWHGCEALI